MTDTPPITPAPKPTPDRVTAILDVIVVAGLLLLIGGILVALAFVNIPEKNETLFAALGGGVIGSGLTAYINYRWGSSRSSATKDSTIAAMASDTPKAP